jgi:hypothetical protein
MRDFLIVLGDISVAGLFETIFGVSWTVLLLVSAATALAAVGFCIFKRTAHLAFRLGRVGLWTGAMACVIAIVATLATARVELMGEISDAAGTIADAAITILATGVVPVVAFFAMRISRRTMEAAVREEGIEPQKSN